MKYEMIPMGNKQFVIKNVKLGYIVARFYSIQEDLVREILDVLNRKG